MSIQKVVNTSEPRLFSILIPTWNNLAYVQKCVNTLLHVSKVDTQIILIVNEGIDGTTEWVKSQTDVDAILSNQNLGICFGLNAARPLINGDYVVYMNDDMVPLPGWDEELYRVCKSIGHNHFMLSSTMIEPMETGNPCVIVKDFGDSLETFEEEALQQTYGQFNKDDWNGSMWPPNLMPLSLWDQVGGMSIEFSPGMYSDPDLCMKLWQAGVRHFQGVGASKVYHFGSKSTRKLKTHPGKVRFTRKWGVTPGYFRTHFLKHGSPFNGPLTHHPRVSLFQRIRTLLSFLKKM